MARYRIFGKELTFINLNLHSVPYEDVSEIVEQVCPRHCMKEIVVMDDAFTAGCHKGGEITSTANRPVAREVRTVFALRIRF